MGLIHDFLRAAAQVFDPRFVGLLARSLALTAALLVGLSGAAVWLVGFLPETVDLPIWGVVETPVGALRGLALGATALLSAFLMFPVAAVFVNLFLDEIAQAVEARHYPDLEPARAMGLVEEVKGSIVFAFVVIGVNLLALVLYVLSGPFAPLVFWAVNGYLLGREYFELAAMRRLDRAGVRSLRRRHWLQVWAAGTAMTVPLSVPVVNLVVPLVGVATYTHMFHRLRRRDALTAARAASETAHRRG